jgi:dipeptidase D
MESYPGWEPDSGSRLLELAKQAYRDSAGIIADVKAVHAGLECGIIGQKFPGIQMVSIGPTIKGAHSPAERVDIKSVEMFWNVLVKLLFAL